LVITIVAVIIIKINSRSAIDTVVIHMPTVSDLAKNPIQVIKTGDQAKVDVDKGIVEVIEHN